MKKTILSTSLALLLTGSLLQAETLTPDQEKSKKAYELKMTKAKESIKKATDHLTSNTKADGRFYPSMAEDYNTISDAYFSMGEYDHAIEWGLRGLKVQMKLLKVDDPKLAKAYADMGNKYYMHKVHPTAVLYILKALELYEKNPKTEPLTLADSYEMVASIYINLNDYEKSLDYGNRCLKVRQKHLKKEDEALQRAMMNIDFLKAELKKRGDKDD